MHKTYLSMTLTTLCMMFVALFSLGFPDTRVLDVKANASEDSESNDVNLTKINQVIVKIPWTVKTPNGEIVKINNPGPCNIYLAGFVFLMLSVFAAVDSTCRPANGLTNAALVAYLASASVCFLNVGYWIMKEYDLPCNLKPEGVKNWGRNGVLLWIIGLGTGVCAIIVLTRTMIIVCQSRKSETDEILCRIGTGFALTILEYNIIMIFAAVVLEISGEVSPEYSGEDRYISPVYAIRMLREEHKVRNFQMQLCPILIVLLSAMAFASSMAKCCCGICGCLPSAASSTMMFGVVALYGVQMHFVFSTESSYVAILSNHWAWSVLNLSLGAFMASLSTVLILLSLLYHSDGVYKDVDARNRLLELRGQY